MNEFKVKWYVADGYDGKSRPHQFSIDQNLISEDMGDDDLENLFFDELDDAFRNRVQFEAENFDEFMEWARGIVSTKGAEND